MGDRAAILVLERNGPAEGRPLAGPAPRHDQEQVAARMGVSIARVSQIESGDITEDEGMAIVDRTAG